MDLRSQLNDQIQITSQLFAQFPWDVRPAYADWLSQTYHFVRHSTRLLALAAAVAKLDQQDSHERMVCHIRNEFGHEKLALNDLSNIGESVSPERSQTRSFYETPRTTIMRYGPVGLIGYMHFLESLAVQCGPILIHQLSSLYDSNSCRFLKVHAAEDIEHVKTTEDELLNLSATDIEVVQVSIQVAGQQYNEILKEIITDHLRQVAV